MRWRAEKDLESHTLAAVLRVARAEHARQVAAMQSEQRAATVAAVRRALESLPREASGFVTAPALQQKLRAT